MEAQNVYPEQMLQELPASEENRLELPQVNGGWVFDDSEKIEEQPVLEAPQFESFDKIQEQLALEASQFDSFDKIEEQPVFEASQFDSFDKIEEQPVLEVPQLDSFDKIEEQPVLEVPQLDSFDKIEEQAVVEVPQLDSFDKIEEQAVVEAPHFESFDKSEEQPAEDIPLLDRLEQQLAPEAPQSEGLDKIEEQPAVSEPAFEDVSLIEAEMANPDPEAPQAYFEDNELSAASPNVMRTRRGTIAFVRHDVGTYINPVYNKCGMLVRVDLNGIALCRRAANQDWMVVDTEGNDIMPSGISSVYFDRQGNLITVTKDGKKVTIGLDGTTHNS
jgi:hypothetical protein